jgi:hypothetical protein
LRADLHLFIAAAMSKKIDTFHAHPVVCSVKPLVACNNAQHFLTLCTEGRHPPLFGM